MPITVGTMTDNALPRSGTLVEMTAGELPPMCGVRVVDAGTDLITLSVAPAQVPAAGAIVVLRWPAGVRGRYVLEAVVVEAGESRFGVRAGRAPEIEQHRNFVRGGGGEHVLLRRPGKVDALGWIRDLSEQGVRAHFADVEVHPGDEIRLRIQLEDELVDMPAEVVKVGSLRQSIPQRGPMSVEVVAVLSGDEHQAQQIRRYVMRQQLLTRTRIG